MATEEKAKKRSPWSGLWVWLLLVATFVAILIGLGPWVALGATLGVSFVWSWIAYFFPGGKFKGSPSFTQALPRNNLNLSDRGKWLEKYGKLFRPRGYFEIGPALWLGPIVHFFAGWDVYARNVTAKGMARGLKISEDGDYIFELELFPPYAHLVFRPGKEPANPPPQAVLGVEIDEKIRKNFPLLPFIAEDDIVVVRGDWVYDRAHRRLEIHPAVWLDLWQ